VIPVTGVRAGVTQVYGGQNISRISLSAGQTVTVTTPTLLALPEEPFVLPLAEPRE